MRCFTAPWQKGTMDAWCTSCMRCFTAPWQKGTMDPWCTSCMRCFTAPWQKGTMDPWCTHRNTEAMWGKRNCLSFDTNYPNVGHKLSTNL